MSASIKSPHEDAVNKFGVSEQERLTTAILSAWSPHDKSLLEKSAMANEENRLESQVVRL